MERNKKNDWRNFEKRREDALRGGSRQNIPPRAYPQPYPAYNNYGFEESHFQSPGSYAIPQPHVYKVTPNSSVATNQPFYNETGSSAEVIHWEGNNEQPKIAKGETGPGNVFEGFAKQRKCRDVLCFALFFAFSITTIVMIAYVGLKGDYRRIMGVDSEGCNICGIKNPALKGAARSGRDKRQSPYLLYSKDDGRYDNSISYLDVDRLYYKVCVSKCPVEYKAHSGKCYPLQRNLTTAADFFTKSGMQNYYTEFTQDLEETYLDVIYMCLIALGVAISVTLLLRFFAAVIIWVVVIGTTIAAIIGTIALWIYYTTMKKKINRGSTDWDRSNLTTLLVFAILATIFTFIILIIVIGMRKRIALVIQLFKEAGKAVQAIPLILFQPFWTFISLAIACSAWFAVLLLIETAGYPETYSSVQIQDTRCRLVKDQWILISRWWNIFAILWMTQFIVGCQHIVVAGTISKWFFSRQKDNLGWPIMRSFSQLIRYHLGSVAFGSLIIAIVKFIRFVLNTLQKRFANGNKVCQAVACCCQCFTWCLEKFLIFLNRNAYIEIAIYGYGFCKSARKAFKVLVNNALRVAAINSIGDFVLFLSKAVIVIITVLVGYQMLKDRDEINHLWIPLVIGGVFAYFIAHCFIGVYEMAIDTIFLCFCEDCARNDGINKPYFMSKGLMEFVKNSRKAMKGMDKEKRKSSSRDQQ